MLRGIIENNKDRAEKIYFVLSRLIGLGAKSLFIWGLLKTGHLDDSYTISLYYLCLTSTMVLYNNEAYYDFYKNEFGKKVSAYVLIKSKITYINNFIIHLMIFASLVFVGNYLLTFNIGLSILFLILISFEKVLDEIQRFNLFAKSFSKWSSIFLAYTILPPLIAFFFVLNGDNFIGVAYLLSLLSILIVIIYFNLPLFFVNQGIKILKQIRYFSFKKYLRIYRDKYIYSQILAYTSNNILVFDKWMLVLVSREKHLLASYYLITQFANSINLVIDYFFVSTRRANFVNKDLSFSAIVDKWKLSLLSISAFFVYACGVSLFLFFQKKNSFLSIHQSLIIGFVFLIHGFFSPVSQYLFWHVTRVKMICIDVMFYISMVALLPILHYLLLFNFINSIIISSLLAHVVRSVFFYLSFFRIKNGE